VRALVVGSVPVSHLLTKVAVFLSKYDSPCRAALRAT
jgi:hypothetical protein